MMFCSCRICSIGAWRPTQGIVEIQPASFAAWITFFHTLPAILVKGIQEVAILPIYTVRQKELGSKRGKLLKIISLWKERKEAILDKTSSCKIIAAY
jgi:hypothetical protein